MTTPTRQRPPANPLGFVGPRPRKHGPLRWLAGHFVRGLLFVVPVGATLWILFAVFDWVDGLIRFPLEAELRIPWTDWTISGAKFARRGAGFLVVVFAVIGIGVLTSNVVTRWILRRVESLFQRLPVVKLIYSAIKDMLQAFVSEEKKFDKPVLLSFSDNPEVEVIGFVTRDELAEFARPGKVAVYVPQSYNFAANLILVPKERVTPIELPAGDVMAFVVSGGVSGGAEGTPAAG